MAIVNIESCFERFDDTFSPKIVGELNGQHVKLARFQGEFVWHAHEEADELFLVVRGSLEMMFRDRSETVGEGEFIIVPRGVEHCPRADDEVEVLRLRETHAKLQGRAFVGDTLAAEAIVSSVLVDG